MGGRDSGCVGGYKRETERERAGQMRRREWRTGKGEGETYFEITKMRQRSRQTHNLLGRDQRAPFELHRRIPMLIRLPSHRLHNLAEIQNSRLRHHIGEEQHAIRMLRRGRIIEDQDIRSGLQHGVEPFMSIPKMLRDVAINMFDRRLLPVGERTAADGCQDDGLGKRGAG